MIQSFYKTSKLHCWLNEDLCVYFSVQHAAVHTGVTIWTTSQSSHHYQTISKTSRWQPRSRSSSAWRRHVFSCFLLAQAHAARGDGCIPYTQHCCKQKQPTCCLIRKRTININLMRSGTWHPARFPKYSFLSQTQKAQKHKKCADKPVFLPHNLKALCFSSLCDYLFICLLIYFSLPRVQRACV